MNLTLRSKFNPEQMPIKHVIIVPPSGMLENINSFIPHSIKNLKMKNAKAGYPAKDLV